MDEEQVAERGQRVQLRAVLRQTAIAGLDVAELRLEHVEWMLDPGPYHGDDPFDIFFDRMERVAFWRLAQVAPESVRPGERGFPLGVDIALVGPDRRLSTMQERVPDLAVLVSRLCTMPLSKSTPTCAFMPKYELLPFFVDDMN